MSSPARDFAGYVLVVDCGNPLCGGRRRNRLEDLAAVQGGELMIARLVARLRCRGCQRAPRTVHLESGAELSKRGSVRRLRLVGPERDDDGR